MNGVRWTTGIGIAIGGVGGAIAALVGAPKAPAPTAHVVAAIASASAAPVVDSVAPPPVSAAAPAEAPPTASVAAAAPTAVAAVAPSAVAPAPSATPAGTAPPLEPATTRDALLKSEMLCDQKQDFDECERAAESIEKGTTGPADAEQAKRFRRIALTHLVKQCEGGSPHACFVMAGKYRAGSELAANPTSAEALEKRGLELCRNRAAPECPSP